MRKLSSKLLLLAAGALLLLFLTNNFGLIDIQKTAIVTAIGIDAGEGGTFDVTAQIAIPDAGGANTASNVAVPGAETVGEAIAELNRKTGWFPTLVHCSLILLGERAAEEDVFRALDYFLRSEYVEDSCLVALCADTAAAALGAGSPIGELASAAIAKVLSAEAQKTGLVSVTNLRDFAKGYFAEGQSGFLPTLRAQPRAQSEGGSGGSSGSSSGGSSEGGSGGSSGGSSEGGSGDSSGGSSEGGSGGGGGSGGQSSAGGGQKSDVFDAAETALWYGRVCAVVYPAVSALMQACGCRRFGVSVFPDFDRKEARARLTLRARIALFFLLKESLSALLRAAKLWMKFRDPQPDAPAQAGAPGTK